MSIDFFDGDFQHVLINAILDISAILCNIFLIIAILLSTPRILQNYAVIILFIAITDSTAALMSMLTTSMYKYIEAAPVQNIEGTIVYVFVGPCQFIHESVCHSALAIYVESLGRSCLLLLISFCYRLFSFSSTISNGPRNDQRIRLCCISLLAMIPSSILAIAFTKGSLLNPPESFRKNPEIAGRIIIVFNLTASHQLSTENLLPRSSIYGIATLYTMTSFFLFILRNKLLKKINLVVLSSDKHRHQMILRSLTIQMLLPLIFSFAFAAWLLDIFEIYRSKSLQRAMMMSTSAFTFIAPLVNIYFIPPYRKFFLNLFPWISTSAVHPSTEQNYITQSFEFFVLVSVIVSFHLIIFFTYFPLVDFRMNQDNIIFISYGVPLVAFYALTVVSIVSIHPRLSSTFYNIYILSSAANLITYLNIWSQRLYQEQFFNFYYHFANWTVVLPIIHQFLVGFCYFAQNINSALLVIDRYVAVAALETTEIWRRRFWMLTAVLYALSGVGYFLTAGFYDLSDVPAFTYIPSSDSFIKDFRGTSRIPLIIGLEAITGIIFVIFCAYLNIVTWIRLRNLPTLKKADRSFFFISLIIFLSQSVNIIILVLYFYFYVISYDRSILLGLFSAMLYTSDVFSLGPGLYMLLVPGPIRSHCFSLVRSIFCRSKVLPSNGSHSTVATIAIISN